MHKWSAWVSTEEQLLLGVPYHGLEPFLGMAVLWGGLEVRQEVTQLPGEYAGPVPGVSGSPGWRGQFGVRLLQPV